MDAEDLLDHLAGLLNERLLGNNDRYFLLAGADSEDDEQLVLEVLDLQDDLHTEPAVKSEAFILRLEKIDG